MPRLRLTKRSSGEPVLAAMKNTSPCYRRPRRLFSKVSFRFQPSWRSILHASIQSDAPRPVSNESDLLPIRFPVIGRMVVIRKNDDRLRAARNLGLHPDTDPPPSLGLREAGPRKGTPPACSRPQKRHRAADARLLASTIRAAIRRMQSKLLFRDNGRPSSAGALPASATAEAGNESP
jgi:hypothetical protein